MVLATAAQVEWIARLASAVCWAHGWRDAASRIVVHDAQAVWTPEATRAAGMLEARGKALWGRLGRKVDPAGVRKDGVPVLSVPAVQVKTLASATVE